MSPQPSNFDGTLSHQVAAPLPPEIVCISFSRNDSSTAFFAHCRTTHSPSSAREATRNDPLSKAVNVASIASRTSPFVAGLIVSRQRPPTARGYGFFVIEDGPWRAQVVIHPELWEAHRQLLRDARALIVTGDAVREGLHLTLRAGALAELETPYRERGYEYA